MHKGYIYLWRKILETSFYNQPLVAHLAIHLLLRANYTTKEIIISGHPLTLNRGQLIAGREALSSKTGLSAFRANLLPPSALIPFQYPR